MKRIAWGLLLFVLLVSAVAGVAERRTIGRLVFASRLFGGHAEVDNFRHAATIFPVRTVHKSQHPHGWEPGAALSLPASFVSDGRVESTSAFLDATDTTGLLVIHNDRIVFEQYWRGNGRDTPWIGWSLTKSFTSALVGAAIAAGSIRSVEDPVTQYLPELHGSAYDGVRIKDVLQMSSGASWNEDYSNPKSDINRFGRTFALGGSLDAFVRTLSRQYPPGSFNRYNTMDSQVLGWLLRRVTGTTESAYLEAMLWQPLGMESDAYWVTDDQGAEFAAGGLNATLRDFAKLGQLYLQGGGWNGRQIIPAEWVRESVTPDAPHLMPGKRASADSHWGYGFQWWVPDASGAFCAVGIYNQFVYVNPRLGLVIAKTSANHTYGLTDDEASDREDEHIAFFKAVEQALAAR